MEPSVGKRLRPMIARAGWTGTGGVDVDRDIDIDIARAGHWRVASAVHKANASQCWGLKAEKECEPAQEIKLSTALERARTEWDCSRAHRAVRAELAYAGPSDLAPSQPAG